MSILDVFYIYRYDQSKIATLVLIFWFKCYRNRYNMYRYSLSSKNLRFFRSGISSRTFFDMQCYDYSAFSMKLSVKNGIRKLKIMNYNKAIISCHSKI